MEKKSWSESELRILKLAVAEEKQSWRESIQPWLPAAFCAVALYFASRHTFISFLPVCFVFMATPIISMRREIAQLHKRLDIAEACRRLDVEQAG